MCNTCGCKSAEDFGAWDANCSVCNGTGWMPKKGDPKKDAKIAKLFGLSIDELTLKPCNAGGKSMGCWSSNNRNRLRRLQRAEEFGAEEKNPYADFTVYSIGMGTRGSYAVKYNDIIEHRILLENPFDGLQNPLSRWMNRKKLKSGDYLTQQIAHRNPDEILFEDEFESLTDALDWIILQVNNGRGFNDFEGEYPHLNFGGQDWDVRFGAESLGSETFASPDDYCSDCHVEGDNSTGRMYLTCDDCGGSYGAEGFEARGNPKHEQVGYSWPDNHEALRKSARLHYERRQKEEAERKAKAGMRKKKMDAETFEATKGMDTYTQPLEELKIKPTKTKVGILLASIVAGGLWYSNKMKE